MANPYVRSIDAVKDMNDVPLYVGVDYDAVVIGSSFGGTYTLGRAQCEEFARAFVAACWEAADNARLMAEEADE